MHSFVCKTFLDYFNRNSIFFITFTDNYRFFLPQTAVIFSNTFQQIVC
jgi:hypothetical protein